MLGFLLLFCVVAILAWGISQVPVPEPFSWVKVIVYCVMAVYLVVAAFRLFGVALPSLG